MRRKAKLCKAKRVKTKLGLPDLEHAKSAVPVSLRSPESQRSYRRSIDDFVCWYRSGPHLSFNKTAVTRYGIHLEDHLLAPGTINVRLAAVRRLAYEAADTGRLLSPDSLRAFVELKSEEIGDETWELVVLLGCGLRRNELIDLTLIMFSAAKITGPLLTWLERPPTSGPCRCRLGEGTLDHCLSAAGPPGRSAIVPGSRQIGS